MFNMTGKPGNPEATSLPGKCALILLIGLLAGCSEPETETSTRSTAEEAAQVMEAPANAEAEAPAATPKATIATADQKAVEQDAMKILADPRMQRQIEETTRIFAASRLAESEDGKKTQAEAVHELAGTAAFMGAITDTTHPRLSWIFNAPREWLGYRVPGSRWAVDNVDNMYRMATIDDTSHYRLTMKPSGPLPAQVSVTVYDNFVGENNGKLDDTLSAFIVDDSTVFNEDGSFTLTVSPEPGTGKGNHMQSKPGSRQFLIRETINDWDNYHPLTISIERIGDPPAGEPDSLDVLTNRAVELLAAATDTLLVFHEKFSAFPENGFSKLVVRAREGGDERRKAKQQGQEVSAEATDWGFVATGGFKLEEGEALAVTVDPMGAEFMGYMLTTPWLVSLEHVHASGSRTMGQADANSDGTITYIIAPTDPGVYNWLDTSGLLQGSMVIRWQQLTRPLEAPDDTAIRNIRRVKLADIGKEFPALRQVTAEEREEELARRAANYQRRCGDTPCEVSNKLGISTWEN